MHALRQIGAQIGANDVVLLLSLVYSAFDIIFEWAEFGGCVQPIQWWLIISYGFVVVFRLSHHLGHHSANEGEDFLLNLRQQKILPWVIVKLTWFVLLPLFTIWTVLGSFWFRDILLYTSGCLPQGAHPWFIGFWLALSYLWIGVHLIFGTIAWLVERRLRTAEGHMRDIEDDDILSRWGRMTTFTGYAAMPWSENKGLSPKEIEQLPTETWCCAETTECSVCLDDLGVGDTVRTLPTCGHTFHKSCIDLWVLRRADCPLCKRQVKPVNKDEGVSSKPSGWFGCCSRVQQIAQD